MQEQLSIKKLCDLSSRAFAQSRYMYSNFLTSSEQSDQIAHEKELLSPYSFEGGDERCERRIAVFGSSELCGYEPAPPIVCIELAPKSSAFSEELSHRDYLGALMALGIRREALGDIFIAEKHDDQPQRGYLFCLDTIAPFIIDNLFQIRRTTVVCSLTDAPELPLPKLEQSRVNVVSERLDAVISAVWRLSRGLSAQLIRAERVYVNSRLCVNTSYSLKEGDAVSARGYGKFFYRGVSSETRKGRLYIDIERLV